MSTNISDKKANVFTKDPSVDLYRKLTQLFHTTSAAINMTTDFDLVGDLTELRALASSTITEVLANLNDKYKGKMHFSDPRCACCDYKPPAPPNTPEEVSYMTYISRKSEVDELSATFDSLQ